MGDEIIEKLKEAVRTYDHKGAAEFARKTIEEKLDPLKAFEAMTEAIREVGEKFSKGELFLPELVGAAEAMQSAAPILQEEIRKSGAKRESNGTVVIGSVFGDMHNIGKTMVGTLAFP